MASAETLHQYRLALLDRIVDLMAESRDLRLTPELRGELRDALEVSYRTLYCNSDPMRRKAPRDAVEALLAQLHEFDTHAGHLS